MRRLRILIADDHAMVVDGFKRLLGSVHDVVGVVTNGRSLLQAAADLGPDLILVDLAMPELNGLDAIVRLKERNPRSRIIVLTMQEDPDMANEAIRRGALGYVTKSSTSSELFEAIDEALRGRVYVSPAIARAPSGVFAGEAVRSKKAGLTLRQREVLQLLAEGKSMKEAAHILDVTPRTIAFHKYSMMEQLGLKTTPELVLYAMTLGLVAPNRL